MKSIFAQQCPSLITIKSPIIAQCSIFNEVITIGGRFSRRFCFVEDDQIGPFHGKIISKVVVTVLVRSCYTLYSMQVIYTDSSRVVTMGK